MLWLYLGECILRYLMYLLVVIASGMIVQQNLTNKICKMVYMHQMFICPLLAPCVSVCTAICTDICSKGLVYSYFHCGILIPSKY